MFGNLGQLMNVMKNAGQIKQQVQEMKARLAAARFSADSGAGQVVATCDGAGELISLKIDPKLLVAGDVEMVEDLCVAAVRSAIRTSREAAQKEIEAVTGGLGLPGMDKLFGQ